MASVQEVFDPRAYARVRRPLLEAETLPVWCYTSDEFYRREVERIFMKEWNFLGRADRVPNPGDYVALNFVGVPLIIVRGMDGRVRAFANSCRHRGSRVVDGAGNCRAFKCPYHGWVYGLDGALRGAAGMEEAKDFLRPSYGLVPIRLETWGGYIFVNFDEGAPSLGTFLGDMAEQLESYRCEDLVTTRRTEYELACNWKLWIENAMEEYHLPNVHKQSLNLKTFKHGTIPTRGNWDAIREKHAGTRALLEEDKDKGFPHIKTLEGPAAEGTQYVLIYPTTMLGMTTDCVWWLETHPLGPNRMKLVVGSSFPKETVGRPDFEERIKYYYKRWDRSVDEDIKISEVQHAGVSSPLARQGRLSHLEPLVHKIANWVLDRALDEPRAARRAGPAGRARRRRPARGAGRGTRRAA